MTDQGNEYDVIEPQGEDVSFRGKTINVSPLTVAQVPAFSRAIRKIVEPLLKSGTDDFNEIDLALMFTEHPEDFIEAVRVASGIDSDELGQAHLDDLLNVAGAALRVNMDFFAHRVAPMLREQMAAITGKLADDDQDGPKSSSDLSPTGTG